MIGLLRVIKAAFHHRLSIACAFACSIGVGALWGANIGAMYPLIGTLFYGESIQETLDCRIEQSANDIAKLEKQIAEDRRAEPVENLDNGLLVGRLEAERRTLQTLRWWHPLVTRYLPTDPFYTIVLVLVIVVAGTVLKGVLLATSEMLVARVADRTTIELRNQFYEHALRMDLSWFQNERVSRLMSRFTHDMQRVRNGVSMVLGKGVREPLKMLACLVGASLVSWQLLLLTLLVTPVGLLLVRWLGRSVKRASKDDMAAMADLYARLAESFRGIMVVKAFTGEKSEQQRFRQASHTLYRRSQRLIRFRALVKPLTETLGVAGVSFGLLAGVYLVLNQETHLFGLPMCDRPLTAAQLIMFYAMLIGASDPARKLAGFTISLQHSSAAADRVYKYLDRQPTVSDPVDPVSLPPVMGTIEFENVSFRYGKDAWTLKEIGLRIERGECIAIVGANGSGKTTLINLLARFYDPKKGCIRFSGVDLKKVRLQELRKRLGLVMQSSVLFDDTIINNIRYGSPEASDQEAIDAARQAGAHAFITEKLQDSYQTVVGEEGAMLSGGEQQRIALARAILRNPDVLILDEATSNIDVEAESLIHQALSHFLRGRTTILVTHHASSLALADRIVVMDDGRIVAVDRHEKLLATCNFYRHLCERSLQHCA